MKESLVVTLSAIGLLTFIYMFIFFLRSIYIYIRPSSLPKYLHAPSGQQAWALITGASDGIGYGFAQELASSGFNVILHGRNESKVNRLKLELESLYPTRSFRIFILDATNRHSYAKLEQFANSVQTELLPVTVLVNNIGGNSPGGPDWLPLSSASRTQAQTTALVDLNTTFPTQVTRSLVPVLSRNTPSLVINIGSEAAHLPLAYCTIYAGAKAYNRAFSRALKAEMKAERLDVEVMHFNVGRVKSAAMAHHEVSFFVPSSREFARAALGRVGGGWASVSAWWPHALQSWIVAGLMPEWVLEKIVISIAKKEKSMEEERYRKGI